MLHRLARFHLGRVQETRPRGARLGRGLATHRRRRCPSWLWPAGSARADLQLNSSARWRRKEGRVVGPAISRSQHRQHVSIHALTYPKNSFPEWLFFPLRRLCSRAGLFWHCLHRGRAAFEASEEVVERGVVAIIFRIFAAGIATWHRHFVDRNIIAVEWFGGLLRVL